MDNGAHFHRCDFQVHTPRDLRWDGARAVTPEERKLCSEEFIQACRLKGLDAIAITDHHDMAFFPYIKEAANNELDDDGEPVPDDKKIVVFPGMELTLAIPCQAILILDADFPENLLATIYPVLGLSPPAPPENEKHAQIQAIAVNNFEELYDKLNSVRELRGRFIVLPNVSEGGNHTLLRSGFHQKYKSMPCVGGYLDGAVSQHGTGNQSITNGKNREYGFKAIGLFQTSDNRTRTFSELGKYSTWVKWARPTAEALRQACLARESRLSQEDPQTPGIWITGIDVSNSKFLGPTELEFNQQYNSIIGGRGTGKSTILEYLRWGLCDQPVDSIDIYEDASDFLVKRKSLIENTLQKIEGEVRVTFLLNNIYHIIKRNSKTNEINLKIADADFVQVTEEDIQNLLPIQAYSQKQLSSVGVKIAELKRFIERPISQDLNKIRFDIKDIGIKIKSTYNQLNRKKEIETEIDKYSLEISSLSSQIKSLRSNLKGVSAEDQEIINQKPIYEIERDIIDNAVSDLNFILDKVDELKEAVNPYPKSVADIDSLINKELISGMDDWLKGHYERIKSDITKIGLLFEEDALKEFNELHHKWNSLKATFDARYDKIKSETTSHQKHLDEIQRVEQRLEEIKKITGEKRKSFAGAGNPETLYQNLKEKWAALHDLKINLLERECAKFNTLSQGSIKAELSKGVNINPIREKLRASFGGMRISQARTDAICTKLTESDNPMVIWENILKELELLVNFKIAETKTPILPETSFLKEFGFTDNERSRISEQLTLDKWLDLITTEIEFNPKFHYGTNPALNEYIPFSDASAGQQATALLTVLLNQSGVPLIIDQPEDDIDNRAMDDIVNQIWNAKTRRQLIFSSHNANLVVNGDSELVTCCDYRRAGDQSGGKIKAEGAIDLEEIKNEITAVMEGGEKAFKLRKEKYGF